MSKETHDIPITLVLPRYEVMAIIHALQKKADFEYGCNNVGESKIITALADRIFETTREHCATAYSDPLLKALKEEPNQ